LLRFVSLIRWTVRLDREPPFFFQKPTDAIADTAASKIVPYPPMTSSLHYEAELVVAIGTGGLRINKEEALDHVFGYAIGCDLTRRDLQSEAKKMGRPWATAKGFDFSAPISAIVPKDESSLYLSLSETNISLRVNGELRQNSTLDKMIWSIPEMISSISQYFQLKPGDIIMTGTPAGVNELKIGDEVDIRCGDLISCVFRVGERE